MPQVDRTLLTRTQQLETEFGRAIAKLASSNRLDLRIFFTMAHGYITGRIARCVGLFNNPNAIMRLNDCFASEYLKAVNGAPHTDWERAFRVCRGDSNAVESGFVGLLFMGPIAAEHCGACMAAVHIKRDLRDALGKVRDVDAQDYGNVLIFVTEANLYAETQLRGRALGAATILVSLPFIQKLNLDVKQWRNDVYQRAYGKPVPNPSSGFAAAYRSLTT